MKTIKRKLNHLTALEKMFLICADMMAIYNLYKNPGAFILTVLLFMLTIACVTFADIEDDE